MKKHIVVLSTAKNESRYLLEWISFHRVVGVNHFYIYDNESTDETGALLRALENRGIVTRVDWPSPTDIAKNVGAYVHFFANFKNIADWVAIIDCDEFLVPRVDENLPLVLSRFKDHPGVSFHWKVFGSSGQEAFFNQTCMTRFTKCSDESFQGNFHVKTIVRPEAVMFPNVHVSEVTGQLVDANYEIVPYDSRGLRQKATFEKLQVNHYFTKSKEEWALKRDRGRSGVSAGAADNIRPNGMFQSMDQNSHADFEVLRYYNKTIDEMVRLAKLCGLERLLTEDALPQFRRNR
jgi:hypothetical protein